MHIQTDILLVPSLLLEMRPYIGGRIPCSTKCGVDGRTGRGGCGGCLVISTRFTEDLHTTCRMKAARELARPGSSA